MLDGNHELMNAAHDFRYVTPGGMRDFGGDRAKVPYPSGSRSDDANLSARWRAGG